MLIEIVFQIPGGQLSGSFQVSVDVIQIPGGDLELSGSFQVSVETIQCMHKQAINLLFSSPQPHARHQINLCHVNSLLLLLIPNCTVTTLCEILHSHS